MPSEQDADTVDRTGAVCYTDRCTGEPTHRVKYERGERWYGICAECADSIPVWRGQVNEGLTPETITTHPVATDGGAEQNAGASHECQIESCDREATHYVEFPRRKGYFCDPICVTCLYAIEAGLDSPIDHRRDMEVEVL